MMKNKGDEDGFVCVGCNEFIDNPKVWNRENPCRLCKKKYCIDCQKTKLTSLDRCFGCYTYRKYYCQACISSMEADLREYTIDGMKIFLCFYHYPDDNVGFAITELDFHKDEHGKYRDVCLKGKLKRYLSNILKETSKDI